MGNEVSAPGEGARGTSLLGMAGHVSANALLVTSAVIYMGWAYDEAYFASFGLAPLDLGLSPVEYGLGGVLLIRPGLLLVLVGCLVAVNLPGAVREWRRRHNKGQRPRQTYDQHEVLTPQEVRGLGAICLVFALTVELAGESGRLPTAVSTLLSLALVGLGVVLLTVPEMGAGPAWARGLALVIAAITAIWASGLYAEWAGRKDAEELAADLGRRPAFTVLSAAPLPQFASCGVRQGKLRVGGSVFYEYENLHRIVERSGTYYLAPSDWARRTCLVVLDTSQDDNVKISEKLG